MPMAKLTLIILAYLTMAGITLASSLLKNGQQHNDTFITPSSRSAPLRPTRSTTGLAAVYSTCARKGQVALTFDDGPYEYLKDISDQLTKHGAKGTFFFNGNNYECIFSDDSISRVRYAVQQGHQIASHTWSHPHLTTLNQDQIRGELTRINDAIRKITGKVPRFLRPPYGEYNNEVRQIASSLGQSLALWNQDTGDSDGDDITYQKNVYKTFVTQYPKASGKAVFLNHETYDSTANELLPFAIQQLQGAGYKLVTLSDCLGINPYLSEGPPSKKDGTWTC